MNRPEEFDGEAELLGGMAWGALLMAVGSAHLVVSLTLTGHPGWAIWSGVWAYFWGLFFRCAWRDSEGR